MTIDDNAFQFLTESGVKAAFSKDDPIGTKVTGTIVAATKRQSLDLDNRPRFFESGDPMMELHIDIQTDERDGADDDGVRRLYVRGGNYTPAEGQGTSMKDAIAKAMKDAGISGFDNVRLTVAFSGMGERVKAAHNAPKLYVAKAEKVAAVTADAAADLLG